MNSTKFKKKSLNPSQLSCYTPCKSSSCITSHPIYGYNFHKTLIIFTTICSSQPSPLIGHILCRNRLLKQVIEGKIGGRIEVTRRRGRRLKQLLDDLNETREYWKLKEEALDRPLLRTRFGRGNGTSRKTDSRMTTIYYSP